MPHTKTQRANTAQQLFSIISDRMGWDTATLNTVNTDQPEVFDLDGVDIATKRIHEAIVYGQQVTIITDYDMDGIAAGILTYAGLSELGAQVNLCLPDYTAPREVTPERIDAALSVHPGTKLIITCDSGINSRHGIEYAQNKLGIDVIVTDHHEGGDHCPAYGVLNPNKYDSDFPIKGICGSQVTYIMLEKYARTYAKTKLTAMTYLKVFAGIGALADVMPMTGWTRNTVNIAVSLLTLALPPVPRNTWGNYDVKQARGMATLPYQSTLMQLLLSDGNKHHANYLRVFYGLSAYLLGLIQKDKLKKPDYIDASFIGFTMAPMFNTVRRIEADMRNVFTVFTPQAVLDASPDFHTSDLTAAIHALVDGNEQRKDSVKNVTTDMLADDQPYAPYVYLVDALPGLLGLIANNLCQTHGLPTVVINPNTLSGSARSPQWAPLLDLARSANTTHDITGITAQGHQHACGFAFDSTLDVIAFVDCVNEFVHDNTSVQQVVPPTLHIADHLSQKIPDLTPDARVDEPYVLVELAQKLTMLEPFGHGFDYPDIAISCDTNSVSIGCMGKDKQHIKITTASGVNVIGWNKADMLDELRESNAFTAHVTLGINEFNDVVSPQAIINHLTLHAD